MGELFHDWREIEKKGANLWRFRFQAATKGSSSSSPLDPSASAPQERVLNREQSPARDGPSSESPRLSP